MRRRSATQSKSPARLAQWNACRDRKQGHVAYPERADNPVRGLVTLMGALMAAPLDHGSGAIRCLEPRFTSIDIANPVVNLIPGEARARL